MAAYEPLGLEPDVVEAIALDANAFKDGQLELAKLKSWMEQARFAELAVWIPETVAWEWAVHAGERYEDLAPRASELHKYLSDVGLETSIPPSYTRDEIVAHTLAAIEALGPPVEIIPCSGDAAREAIRDQILGRRPGGRKHGVRTGAADSAALRAMRERAFDDPDIYVIVSRDKGLPAAFESWGIEAPAIFPNWYSLRKSLLDYKTAAYDQALAVLRFLFEQVEGGDPLSAINLGVIDDAVVDEEDLRARYGADLADVRSEIDRLTAVLGVSDVQVGAGEHDWAARAFLAAEATTQVWGYDSTNDGIVLWPGESESSAVVLSVDLILTLEGKMITRADPDEEIRAFSGQHRWHDRDDVLAQVMDALTAIPDLAEHVPDPIDPGVLELPLRNGRSVHLELEDRGGDGWQLTAQCEGDEVTLRCEFDADAWVGGSREGQFMEAPWKLKAEGPLAFAPLWAINEMVVRKRLE